MNCLLKYKPWLTLADATKYLNKSTDVNVTETDLLWLALEGHLKIAARFACPVAATAGTVSEFSVPDFACESIALEPFPIFPGIEGVFELRLTPKTLRLNLNGVLESSEILGGFVFNTAEPGKVVVIDSRTLPETACWGIRSCDLLQFESKHEEVSSPLPAPPREVAATIGTSKQLQVEEKPKKKADRQDQAVIEILKKLGYDPKALPPRPPGFLWVKSEVKKVALDNRRDLFTTSSFDKTWDRLRRDGEILDLT